MAQTAGRHRPRAAPGSTVWPHRVQRGSRRAIKESGRGWRDARPPESCTARPHPAGNPTHRALHEATPAGDHRSPADVGHHHVADWVLRRGCLPTRSSRPLCSWSSSSAQCSACCCSSPGSSRDSDAARIHALCAAWSRVPPATCHVTGAPLPACERDTFRPSAAVYVRRAWCEGGRG